MKAVPGSRELRALVSMSGPVALNYSSNMRSEHLRGPNTGAESGNLIKVLIL